METFVVKFTSESNEIHYEVVSTIGGKKDAEKKAKIQAQEKGINFLCGISTPYFVSTTKSPVCLVKFEPEYYKEADGYQYQLSRAYAKCYVELSHISTIVVGLIKNMDKEPDDWEYFRKQLIEWLKQNDLAQIT